MTKFEERLWSRIRNFVELGHNKPAMLVAAVRIVEIQELVDKQLEHSGKGTTVWHQIRCDLNQRRLAAALCIPKSILGCL